MPSRSPSSGTATIREKTGRNLWVWVETKHGMAWDGMRWDGRPKKRKENSIPRRETRGERQNTNTNHVMGGVETCWGGAEWKKEHMHAWPLLVCAGELKWLHGGGDIGLYGAGGSTWVLGKSETANRLPESRSRSSRWIDR